MLRRRLIPLVIVSTIIASIFVYLNQTQRDNSSTEREARPKQQIAQVKEASLAPARSRMLAEKGFSDGVLVFLTFIMERNMPDAYLEVVDDTSTVVKGVVDTDLSLQTKSFNPQISTTPEAQQWVANNVPPPDDTTPTLKTVQLASGEVDTAFGLATVEELSGTFNLRLRSATNEMLQTDLELPVKVIDGEITSIAGFEIPPLPE